MSLGAAVSINNFDTYAFDGALENVFSPGETVTFQANASLSDNASLQVTDPDGAVQATPDLVKVQDSPYQIYQYNYSLSTSNIGEWSAFTTVTNNSTSESDGENFYVANDTPHFTSYSTDESYLRAGENITFDATILDADNDLRAVNITFRDSDREYRMNEISSGEKSDWRREITTWRSQEEHYNITAIDINDNSQTVSGTFHSYLPTDPTNISVKITPSCSSTLDYFLLPGDGEIVQNKTGVFVEIPRNSGNVESNITIEYLNVTSEGQDPYSWGEPEGPVIQSYEGEEWENVRIGESVTYFKLFKASYETGNYTGHSEISTGCSAEGALNQEYEKQTLNSTYQCDSLNSSDFGCYNFSVEDTNTVVSETVSVNTSETTDTTVEEQRDGTEAYLGTETLNETSFDFYVFNGSSTDRYDYSCATDNSTIEEAGECAYESNTISEHSIKVQDIAHDGSNATYSLMRQNNDYLNTSLDCDSVDNETAQCNSTLTFFESFEFFGNFEIVTAIGDEAGGANESGNQTSNVSIPGDDPDEPGETEVPEPEPTPTPVPTPEPEPELSVEITPQEEKYTTRQGLYAAATINATNLGNTAVENVSLVPQIDKFREGWEVRNARIQNLSVNETVERDVFVQPPEDASTGTYVVPVSAELEDRQLDLDYFQLEVLRSEFLPRLKIEEAPKSVNVPVETNQSFPVLVENTGRINVTDVDARIQNAEDCAGFSTGEIEFLDVNGTQSIQVNIEAGETTSSCNSTLVVSSSEGAYAFSDMQITVIPEEGVIPQDQRVPLIAILWTLLLAVYAFFTRELHLESPVVRIPFLVIILGEVFILIYTVANYYALPLSSFLPF